jgi:hypothetical protein
MLDSYEFLMYTKASDLQHVYENDLQHVYENDLQLVYENDLQHVYENDLQHVYENDLQHVSKTFIHIPYPTLFIETRQERVSDQNFLFDCFFDFFPIEIVFLQESLTKKESLAKKQFQLEKNH